MLSVDGLRRRAALLRAIRAFFHGRDYLEVDTPLRQPVLIPEANIRPLRAEGGWLQASPELCMKRLLARGCERIFQICPCFRAGERGRLHHEEFTMLEWYRIGWGYGELMVECEALLAHLAAGILEGRPLSRQGREIELGSGCGRLTVAEAFDRYASIGLDTALATDRFDECIAFEIEPRLGWDRPLLLHDYPPSQASLARLRADDGSVAAERFELYIAGIELANGFSELCDPEEQRRRFGLEMEKMQVAGLDGAMPESLLGDLARIDSAAGIALGLDRLCMLLLGRDSIDDAVAFPPNTL